MDTPIGAAAGRMWQSLAASGEATLPPRQCGTTLPARLLLRGGGWLARADNRSWMQEQGGLPLSWREL